MFEVLFVFAFDTIPEALSKTNKKLKAINLQLYIYIFEV